MQTVESLLSKGIHKNKKTMRSMVVVFYLQNGNKGINERSELLPAEAKAKAKAEAKHILPLAQTSMTQELVIYIGPLIWLKNVD